MSRNRILVVFYSRTGLTRQIGKAIAAALGADLEDLRDRADRRGVAGWLRSGLESLLGASTEIEPPKHDPSRYELVVVGTPVWASGVSSPVRTYLWMQRARLPRLTFFLTHGGTGAARAFALMAAVAGKRPIATLAVRERQIASGAHREPLALFAAKCTRTIRHPSRTRRRAAAPAAERAEPTAASA